MSDGTVSNYKLASGSTLTIQVFPPQEGRAVIYVSVDNERKMEFNTGNTDKTAGFLGKLLELAGADAL